MKYQISNKEREYLGLDPIHSNWDLVEFRGDQYRPESILVFDGDIVKKQITSTKDSYKEYQYDDLIRNREFITPKTKRGKEKKLTPSTFEKIKTKGVYFIFRQGKITIASTTTQTTFYSTLMEGIEYKTIEDFKIWLRNFITKTSDRNRKKIELFKSLKRKNIKSKKGDVFAFKIDRNNYGYGQIIEDIHKLRKTQPDNHGLGKIIGKPLLIRIFHHKSEDIELSIDSLKETKTTPSQYIFDNHIFYGEYPIIGNFKIPKDEVDYPISYREASYVSHEIYLQWGLIHKQKSFTAYNKHLSGINEFVSKDSPDYRITNPYSNNDIGFQLDIDKQTIIDCIESNSNKPYWNQKNYKMKRDLRNPMNKKIRDELFKEFQINKNEYLIQDAE